MDWVYRSFGSTKEAINVTMNQSCQEEPSQTIEDSSKEINVTSATNDGNSLWSDEVGLMEENYIATISANGKDRRHTIQEKQADNVYHNATVNPSIQQTRVKDIHGSKIHHSKRPTGVDKGSVDEDKITKGADFEVTRKKQTNGIVNTSKTVKVLSSMPADLMEFEGVEHVNDVPGNVLEKGHTGKPLKA
ncbi:hypothetical protein A4A49_07144 [Nicotiana attenuata]|uniref:Uncharacterized protein n=1 Tax=Nicotiana attenuata TaxID=49451 RepID=A0A314KV06_NICAT|nr:hypothetical protein A4A49_07144 [Nicotiana attenuata]